MKAEKKKYEAREYKLKKQKLIGQAPKVEKQDKTTSGKEDPTPEKDDPEKQSQVTPTTCPC